MKYLVYVRREYDAYVEVDADNVDSARNLVANKAYKVQEMVQPDEEVSVMANAPEGFPDSIKYEDLK